MIPPSTQASAMRIPTAEEIAHREAARTRLRDVRAQILAAESSLRSLKKERRTLETTLAEYTYPVLTLPTEIVAHIFDHFLPVYPQCPPISGPLAPTTLGQVCHDWREIALSAPTLWRAISLSLLFDDRGLKRNLNILETWLKRSRSYPVSIRLEGPQPVRHERGVHSLKLEPFIEAIIAQSARLQYLKIKLPLNDIPRFKHLNVPLLRSFSIGSDSLWDPSIEAPQLRKVVLDRFHNVFAALIPWTQLTTLRIQDLLPHEFMDILHRTVNLVHCRFTIFTSQHHGDADHIDPRPLTLLHLETLILMMDGWVNDDSALPGWFGLTTFPSLRKLQVSAGLLHPDPISTLRALISRSRCSLKELYIPMDPMLADACRTALPTIPLILSGRSNDIGHRLFADDSSIMKFGVESDSEDDGTSQLSGDDDLAAML
ncbi:hypothetical protein DFH06DRAFT_1467925 [Mycena polygramma]|nr:hypothetical protein DFH06DRAFT_1467925 [Mycena polygramma]